MQSHYISYKNSLIHYRRFGDGKKLLFCFHGYGRDSTTFSFLAKYLGSRFTLIAIDLPFHGLTQWKDALIFKPASLSQMMIDISHQLKIQPVKFSILGFSMGGRVALHLTRLLPHHVERLILLAPDGLSFNFWRWVGSRTFVGRTILHYTMQHPHWLLRLVNMAEKWKLMHKSLADFVRYYINQEVQRKILYRRWITMRKFTAELTELKKLIKKNKIPVKMLFGAFDKVIPARGGQKFVKGIEAFATVEVVQLGHHLLTEGNVKKIVQLIND